jgi:hypothetical protein
MCSESVWPDVRPGLSVRRTSYPSTERPVARFYTLEQGCITGEAVASIATRRLEWFP